MAAQDEMIARLNREKKNMDEGTKQLNEKLQAEEDKVNHLNKLKQKLESTLDEVRIQSNIPFVTITKNKSLFPSTKTTTIFVKIIAWR